ncbi:MAG: hypothetical protein U1A78_34535 [Polyangia bacterium]
MRDPRARIERTGSHRWLRLAALGLLLLGAMARAQGRPGTDPDSLRRVLWEPLSSERANIVMGALGPIDRSHASPRLGGTLRFPQDGVWLRLGRADGERVVAVELRDGSDGEAAYSGPLPLGLRFGLQRAETERLLGGTPCPGRPSCLYRARGLELLYSQDQRLSGLRLVPDLSPTQAGVTVRPVLTGTTQDGVFGAAVGFTLRSYSLSAKKLVTTTLTVEDAQGRPVLAAKELLAFRGPGGAVSVRAQRSVMGMTEASLFVPYYALQLPPGAHLLRFRVSATQAGTGRSPRSEPGGGAADAIIQMPVVKALRLGVRSAEVGRFHGAGGVIAGALTAGASTLFVSPGDKPDLFWTVEYGGRGLYRSPVRYKRKQAEWTGSSDWMRVAAGDRLRIHVYDRRVASDAARFFSGMVTTGMFLYPMPVRSYGVEEMGVFDLSVDQLLRSGDGLGPMKNGSITRLLLSPPQVRD